MPRKHRSHSPSSMESENDIEDEERKKESGTSDTDSDSDVESSSNGRKSVDFSGSESDNYQKMEVQYEHRPSKSLEKRFSGERSRDEIKQWDKDGVGDQDGRRSRSSSKRTEPYQHGSQEWSKRRSRSHSKGSFKGNERSYRDQMQSRSASPKSHQKYTAGRKPISNSKSRSSAPESKRSEEVRNRPQTQYGSLLSESSPRKSGTRSVESGRNNSSSPRSRSASKVTSLRNVDHKELISPSYSPRHRRGSPGRPQTSGQNRLRPRSSSGSPRQKRGGVEKDKGQSIKLSPVSKGSPLKSRVHGVQKGSKNMSASLLVERHGQDQKSNPHSSSKSPASSADNIQNLKRSQKSDFKRKRSRSRSGSSSPEKQDSNSSKYKERNSSSVSKSPRQPFKISKSNKDKLSRLRSRSQEVSTWASSPAKSSKEPRKIPTKRKSSRSGSDSQSPVSRSRPQSTNIQAIPLGDKSGLILRSQSPMYQDRSPKQKTLSSSVQIVRVSRKDSADSHESGDQSRSQSPMRRGSMNTRHDMRRFESEPESGEITSSDGDAEGSMIPAIRSAVQKPRTPELQRGNRNNIMEMETWDGSNSRKRYRFDTEEEEDRGGNREWRMDDSRVLGKRPAEEIKDSEVGKPETVEPAEKKAKTVGDILTGRTGGAYIPPAKLWAMQAAITDKSSVDYQRLSWEALKKSINGLVNKVNISNIINIVRELFQENIVRGRGLLARSIIQAQSASPTFTHVYAALVAIINTKFPQIGELILRRLVIQFKRGFKRNDKNICLSATRFIAHLVNQQMAHEVLSLEILTLLLETPTDDSVEVAIGFLKECGKKLTEVSQRGINAIFERLRNILHEGTIDTRVQYMIEVMFAIRKDGFKDHPAVMEELDLVEEADQFTHMMMLEDANNTEDIINVFKPDPDFLQNEEKYKVLKKEILDERSDSESEEGSGSGSGSGDSDSSEEEGSDNEEGEEGKQTIVDNTETNLVILRRTIYLTVQSSLDFEECAHKMMKMDLKPGQEVELCNMILDCCAQLRTYEKFFGLLAQRFCQIDKKYITPFQAMFAEQYNTIHRLETNKLRNVAKFFGHLLFTDAISWGVLSAIRLNEEDTTSASRIFIKILFQELSEYMGLPKLNERLKDPTLQEYFEGLLPRDDPRKTRFAINFFTTIGLGGLTDDLRDHLKNVSKKLMQQKQEEEEEESSSSSSDEDKEDDGGEGEEDDSDSDNSSSSDDSESDSNDSSGSSSSSDEDQRKKKTREKVPNPKDRQNERDKYNGILKEKTDSKDKKKRTDSDHEERSLRQDQRERRRKGIENDVDANDRHQSMRKKSNRNSDRTELDSASVSKRNRNVDKENDRISDRDSRKKNDRRDFDVRVGGSGAREIEERDSDELRNNSERSRDRRTDYVHQWERNKQNKQDSGSGSKDYRRRSRSFDRQRWDHNSSPKEVRRKERYRRSVSEEHINDAGRYSRRRR
ncbi:hypothetical protein CHS0354_040617 [Potamilus streckersoni]|uniref:MI domain-containing protein n=1 Tax=Potamilus streckersoni TaxID=2493646 RepID=A0AAE0VVN9_9BIVA|nr:hypothetical protein CHS0354_040617 [Potamilus streckersoni]